MTKPANPWIFVGAIVAGLIHGQALLRAQPAPADRDLIVIDGEDGPWSQGVPIERRAAARELFREGNRLFRLPLFARAAEQYLAALSTWKHPAFYFNLALAQLNLGQQVEARESLEHALAYGGEPLGAAQFQEAQKQLREVKRQLGRIRVTCPTRGAEVTLDGVTLFTGPGSEQRWVQAKTHELTAKKAGYLSEARRVAVSPEVLEDLELRLVTLDEATDASRRWAAWKPWAIVAAGAAVAASGGVFHALSARSFNTYDEQFLRLECATPSDSKPDPGCKGGQIPEDLSDRLSLARRQQTIAVGSYLVGGSLIAAGAVLLYLNRPRLEERSSARSVVVAPAVAADMLGILVSVSH